jgi:hypothetical protein
MSSVIYVNKIDNKTGEIDTTGTGIETIDYVPGTLFEGYFNPTKRGILIKKTSGVLKYDFIGYKSIKENRGNVPFMYTRALELRNDQETYATLQQMYPEYAFTFGMVNHSLENLYKQVHTIYIESHVKHLMQVYPAHPMYRTLKQLHSQYKTTGSIITKDIVKEKVNSLNTYVIAKLLNWVKY